LKEEELMALLENIIVETKKEVVGRICFLKIDHIAEIREVVGMSIFISKWQNLGVLSSQTSKKKLKS
jgi:hypothetical protein